MKVKVVIPFYGIAENTSYAAGRTVEFTDERAKELMEKLPGYLEPVQAKKAAPKKRAPRKKTEGK